MSAWARTGTRGYAEWFPERDLHIDSRWEHEPSEAPPERLPVHQVQADDVEQSVEIELDVSA